MENPLLELHSDHPISSFAQATATGLSRLLDRAHSHDQVTRFLSGADYTSRDLWFLVKKPVRAVEPDDPGPKQPLLRVHLRLLQTRTTQAEASGQPLHPQSQALPHSPKPCKRASPSFRGSARNIGF